MSVVRWFVSSRREFHGSECRSDHRCGVLARWLLVAAFGRTAPLTFLQGVTLYLVMGDGGSLHERSDWDDQVDDVIHNLYQLFGVGAPAHRGLLPFIGGLCGDHSRTAPP